MDAPLPCLLTTARLGLRLWKPSDLEVFAAMNRDPVVREFNPRILMAEGHSLKPSPI